MYFVDVKGQQRSNIVNNALYLPNLVSRTADALHAKNDDDLVEVKSQHRSNIKYSKQCSMATKLGQKNC